MNKIKYYQNLYLGEDIEYKDLFQIKRELRFQPLKANVYLLTIAKNVNDQLEIYHSKYLVEKYYSKHSPYVIGIFRTKEEAVALIEKLMQECVTARQDANLKAYLIGE